MKKLLQSIALLIGLSITIPLKGQVIIYDDINYQGNAQQLNLNWHDSLALQKGIGINKLKSIQIEEGYEVKLYTDGKFKTLLSTYDKNVDQTSTADINALSIKVIKKIDENYSKAPRFLNNFQVIFKATPSGRKQLTGNKHPIDLTGDDKGKGELRALVKVNGKVRGVIGIDNQSLSTIYVPGDVPWEGWYENNYSAPLQTKEKKNLYLGDYEYEEELELTLEVWEDDDELIANDPKAWIKNSGDDDLFSVTYKVQVKFNRLDIIKTLKEPEIALVGTRFSQITQSGFLVYHKNNTPVPLYNENGKCSDSIRQIVLFKGFWLDIRGNGQQRLKILGVPNKMINMREINGLDQKDWYMYYIQYGEQY